MEIRIKGEMTIAEIRQALFEKLMEVETEYGVRYSRGAALYINPTNGFGDDVKPINQHGQSVEKIYSEGPYRSAADDYKV
jgi:hypothetical protein